MRKTVRKENGTGMVQGVPHRERGGKGRLLALGRNVCLATPICLGMVTKENFPNTLESKEQVFRTKELFFQELSKS